MTSKVFNGEYRSEYSASRSYGFRVSSHLILALALTLARVLKPPMTTLPTSTLAAASAALLPALARALSLALNPPVTLALAVTPALSLSPRLNST